MTEYKIYIDSPGIVSKSLFSNKKPEVGEILSVWDVTKEGQKVPGSDETITILKVSPLENNMFHCEAITSKP